MKKSPAYLSLFTTLVAILFFMTMNPVQTNSQVAEKGNLPVPVFSSIKDDRNDVVAAIADTWKKDKAYVESVLEYCRLLELKFAIPPAVTLSIFEQESGNAGANLRPDGSTNNLYYWYHVCFGLKAHPGAKTTPYWNGEVLEVEHDELEDGDTVTYTTYFRVYPDLYTAFLDWGLYLSTAAHYEDAFACKEKLGYKCFVKGLEPKYGLKNNTKVVLEPGYSTDPNWGKSILSRIYEDNFRVLFK